jgi:hypothetical protein
MTTIDEMRKALSKKREREEEVEPRDGEKVEPPPLGKIIQPPERVKIPLLVEAGDLEAGEVTRRVYGSTLHLRGTKFDYDLLTLKLMLIPDGGPSLADPRETIPKSEFEPSELPEVAPLVAEKAGCFKAEGDKPKSWSVRTKLTGPDALTRVIVDEEVVADFIVRGHLGEDLADEVVKVARAVLWSALRGEMK